MYRIRSIITHVVPFCRGRVNALLLPFTLSPFHPFTLNSTMRRETVVAVGMIVWVCGAISPGVFAQEKPWRFSGSFGLTAASLAEPAAGTGSSVGVRLGMAPRLYDVLAASLEGGVDYLGALCFEAGAACAAARSRSSETFMLSASGAVGLLTPRVSLGARSEGVDVALGLFAGREWVEAGLGRGACINCRVDGLRVQGGLFVEPTLELWFFPGVALGAAYRAYSPASDIQGRLTVRLTVRGAE
jgi:hypothetical protein